MIDFVNQFWTKVSTALLWVYTSAHNLVMFFLDGFKLIWAVTIGRWVALATYVTAIVGIISALWAQASASLGSIATDLNGFNMGSPSAVSALGIINYLVPVEEILWGITFVAGLYLAVLSVRAQFFTIKLLIGFFK